MPLTEDEARAFINARIDSRQWWVFVVPPGFTHYLDLIEDRFYTDERSRFFESIHLPPLTIAMVKKRCMSAQALAAIMAEGGGEPLPAKAIKGKDVILPCSPRPEETALFLGFHEWLMGRTRTDVQPDRPRAGKKRWRKK